MNTARNILNTFASLVAIACFTFTASAAAETRSAGPVSGRSAQIVVAKPGSLAVTVHDENGKPISGAIVEITPSGGGNATDVSTDGFGRAFLKGLRSGGWRLLVLVDGQIRARALVAIRPDTTTELKVEAPTPADDLPRCGDLPYVPSEPL